MVRDAMLGEVPADGGVGNSRLPVRNAMIQEIVDAIEERVIAELERRGLRHNPGVF
jgi:hypothetical protein